MEGEGSTEVRVSAHDIVSEEYRKEGWRDQ